MKKIAFLLILLCAEETLNAQTPQGPLIYEIFGDSVKITNDCDTAELIIENHTQNVPGFLFNKGRGRTEFRRGLLSAGNNAYLIGNDTLKLSPFWKQGGNSFGVTGILGTLDTNHLDFYTNNLFRGRWTKAGNFVIGSNDDNGYNFKLNGTSLFTGQIICNDKLILKGNNTNGLGQLFLFNEANDFNTYIGSYGNDMLFRVRGGPNVYRFTFGDPLRNLTFKGDVSNKVQITSANHEIIFGDVNSIYNNSNAISILSNNYTNGAGIILERGTRSDSLSDPIVTARQSSVDLFKVLRNGRVLVGEGAKHGHQFQVSNSIYTRYFTNIPTAVGSSTSGALRLRWGGGEGTYVDFHYQGNDFRRGWIGSAADSRPLYIQDQVGFSFWNTPFVSIGSEWNDNAKLSVKVPFGSAMDALSIARHITADTGAFDFIVKSSGNILVGSTTDNGHKLQVTGNSFFNGGQQITGMVRFSGLASDNNLSRVLVADAAGNIYYRDASTLAVTDVLKSSLAVNGAISAQKMTITQPGTWPDYVFNTQYKLPTLKDIEHYIQQNRHLPDIPSAAEVEKNGIDVGANQAALLKKIEELTLYLIEQEKRSQQQQEQIAVQNKAMQSLQQEVAELKSLIKK